MEQFKILPEPVAVSLYDDLRQIKDSFISPYDLSKGYDELDDKERSVWLNKVSLIPDKIRSLKMFIRPFREYCRTCIITDEEIISLAVFDHDLYCRNNSSKVKTDLFTKCWEDLAPYQKRFFIESNYLTPVELKKSGYEIVRDEEVEGIDEKLVWRIARAIHSRYLGEIRKQKYVKGGKVISEYSSRNKEQHKTNLKEFDELPDETKYSNIDNAHHIPTKLLAIGYRIKPVKKGYRPYALHLDEREVETMARVEHLRWSWDRRLNGWTYGKTRDEVMRRHPGLVPYDELSESEKEKDRELVRMIPGLLIDLNYEARPVNPDRVKNLSYAIKPNSSIERILDETRKLSDQVRQMVTLTPVMEEIVRNRNQKIEEAIREVEGSYNYAQHIQQSFLPDDLYIRECFPRHFVLYLPKDIVSGDFYFFSKHENLLIFAAADCTGHGIPGAMLSTIGYGILDQAVNELKLTDPALILDHLYSRLDGFLRRGKHGIGVSDDMDIVVCILDNHTNILTFAGVTNPVYHLAGGRLTEYRAQNSVARCNYADGYSFVSETIELNPGDNIYLFSDGYTDQFGGKDHRKYQSTRFKEFLLTINDLPMPEQCDRLFEEIEEWRDVNREEQTDDILVIGIRI